MAYKPKSTIRMEEFSSNYSDSHRPIKKYSLKNTYQEIKGGQSRESETSSSSGYTIARLYGMGEYRDMTPALSFKPLF
ncbi:MAG: hypothetical protein Q8L29_03540 [archaeon]|nr:hypothetical protein [archaeon]